MSRPRRRGRDVHGVLLLDKPQGASSNDVLQKVKRIYNANRAGHTGALDPLATGMLPICLGEATKFSQYLLDSDKRYRVIAKLGQRTDTSDADGQVVEERPLTFSDEQLAAALDSFRGETQQVPSMYSALKYQGKKLYEYARQGIDVPREARPINVYELLFIRHEGDELELEIHCSKGTYIRTIIDDLGEKLGCGAHVIYLRRLAVSKYPVERMVTLEQLQDALGQVEVDPAVTRLMGAGEQPKAPGMKYRHYAPKAPVTVVAGEPKKAAEYIAAHAAPEDGVICFDEFKDLFTRECETRPVMDLGPAGDKGEQARHIFDALRAFDHTAVTAIWAQCPDTDGIGLAIANRLNKAAGFHIIRV